MLTKSLIDSMPEYEAYLRTKELSEHTVRKYISDIEHMLAYLNVTELTHDDIVEYKAHLLSKYKSSTVNSYIISINGFFKWLERDKLCVGLVKVQRRYFSSAQMSVKNYHLMLDYAKSSGRDKKWYLIMRCLGGMGIRVGELKFITVDAVHCGYAEINFKSKQRTILIPEELRNMLIDHCAREELNGGSVFLNKKHTAPIDPSVIWRNLKRIADKVGIDSSTVYPHSFRHMFARTYMEVYGNIVDLADILGHSSIETTRIYTKQSKEAQRNKLDKLGL